MQKTFKFKIYTPFEAILLFIFSLAISTGVLVFIGKYIDLKDWHEQVLKALVLMMILVLFSMMQKVSSIILTVEMDLMGINFTGYRTWLGIFKADKYISWIDIDEWLFQEGHTNGHSWSPDVFTLKHSKGKKLRLFLTDTTLNHTAFQSFLSQFNVFAEEINVKNKGIKTVKQSIPLEDTKVYVVIMSFIFLALPIAMAWSFFYEQPLGEWKWWELTLSILMVLGFFILGVFMSYSQIKKVFFKK
jgi:hypothetical protein